MNSRNWADYVSDKDDDFEDIDLEDTSSMTFFTSTAKKRASRDRLFAAKTSSDYDARTKEKGEDNTEYTRLVKSIDLPVEIQCQRTDLLFKVTQIEKTIDEIKMLCQEKELFDAAYTVGEVFHKKITDQLAASNNDFNVISAQFESNKKELSQSFDEESEAQLNANELNYTFFKTYALANATEQTIRAQYATSLKASMELSLARLVNKKQALITRLNGIELLLSKGNYESETILKMYGSIKTLRFDGPIPLKKGLQSQFASLTTKSNAFDNYKLRYKLDDSLIEKSYYLGWHLNERRDAYRLKISFEITEIEFHDLLTTLTDVFNIRLSDISLETNCQQLNNIFAYLCQSQTTGKIVLNPCFYKKEKRELDALLKDKSFYKGFLSDALWIDSAILEEDLKYLLEKLIIVCECELDHVLLTTGNKDFEHLFSHVVTQLAKEVITPKW